MKKKIIALLKGSLVLTISNICIKAINFFLLPLYTKYLPPSQLGLSDSITTLIGLIFPLLVLGLDSAFSAFYYDKKSEHYQKQVFSTVFYVLLLTSIVAICCMPLSGFVASRLLKNGDYAWLICVGILGMCINLWYLPFSLLVRIQNRMRIFAIVNVVCSLFMIVSNIILVSVVKMGAASLIISTCVVNGLMLILYLVVSGQLPKLSYFDLKLCKAMLRYSIPLVPMVVSTWILVSSDRLILLNVKGDDAVGIYGIAMRFVNIVNVFTNSVYMAYTTFAFDSKNEKKSKEAYVRILDVLYLSLLVVVMTVSFFSKEILVIMVKPQYYSAYLVMPGLLFAQLLYAANTIVGYGLAFEKKSVYTLLAVSFAAVVNLVLNVILIPQYGMVAAAMTTWFGYLLMLVMTNRFSQKFYACPYRLKKLLLSNVCILAICLFSLWKVSFVGRISIFLLALLISLYAYKDTLYMMLKELKKVIKK